MVAKRKTKKKSKTLAAKDVAAKEANEVKGGYIGETEKLKSSSSSINWGDARKTQGT